VLLHLLSPSALTTNHKEALMDKPKRRLLRYVVISILSTVWAVGASYTAGTLAA
jgi:hypothetical protein